MDDAFALGSSYRRQHFRRPHSPDSFDGSGEILLFGHPDRDRLEAREPGRAAQGTAARSIAAEHARFVADPICRISMRVRKRAASSRTSSRKSTRVSDVK
jgi:hypothetical protein